jgi:hypothetical protein
MGDKSGLGVVWRQEARKQERERKARLDQWGSENRVALALGTVGLLGAGLVVSAVRARAKRREEENRENATKLQTARDTLIRETRKSLDEVAEKKSESSTVDYGSVYAHACIAFLAAAAKSGAKVDIETIPLPPPAVRLDISKSVTVKEALIAKILEKHEIQARLFVYEKTHGVVSSSSKSSLEYKHAKASEEYTALLFSLWAEDAPFTTAKKNIEKAILPEVEEETDFQDPLDEPSWKVESDVDEVTKWGAATSQRSTVRRFL